MKKPLGIALAVAAACGLAGAFSTGLAAEAKTAVVWTAGDVKWADNPGVAGAKIAVLWGDPKRGAYGALKKIPAGASLPRHSHTHDSRVVGVSGTIALTMDGAAGPKDMAAGSYALLPGGAIHAAQCKSGADCTYFEEQAGAADFKLAK